MVPFWGSHADMVGALVFAVAFELSCLIARFGFGKKSTQNTSLIGRVTFGLRIHHGYVGLALVLCRNLFPVTTLPCIDDWQHLAAIIGWGVHPVRRHPSLLGVVASHWPS